MKNLTAEEKLAEKLRQQRLQEEADLQVILDFDSLKIKIILKCISNNKYRILK